MFGYFLLFKDDIYFVYFRSNKILEKLNDSRVFRVTVLICILAVFVRRNTPPLLPQKKKTKIGLHRREMR